MKTETTTKEANFLGMDLDWPTVGRYLLGGALVGGGTAAATSFVNYLRSLRQKQKALKDTDYDDDTLYVNLPAKQASTPPGAPTPQVPKNLNKETLAASLLASILGGMGAYNLVRNVYVDRRKREAQRDLDEAQVLYLDKLGQGRGMGLKQASPEQGNFDWTDKAVAIPAVALGLFGIGSAAATNAILSNYFPGFEKAKLQRPRRVVIRRAPMYQQREKRAPLESDEITQAEIEALMRTKAASNTPGILDGMISAVAQGRLEDVKQAIESSGIEEALNLVEGAQKVATNRFDRDIAITVIASDPLVSNAVLPYVAADARDMMPHYCKLAAQPEMAPYLEDLRGMAEAVSELGRQQAWTPVAERVLKVAGVTKEASRRALGGAALEMALPEKALMGLMLMDFLGRKGSSNAGDEGAEGNPSTLTTSKVEDSSATLEGADTEADAFVKKNPGLANALLSEVNGFAA